MTDQPTTSASLHGPGGLLATPGLGSRRRRWGRRLKAQQIAGNLYRGNDGKFQAGGAGGPAAPKKPSAGARPPAKQTLPAVKPLKQPRGRRGRAAKPAGPDKAAAQAQRTRDRLASQMARAAQQAKRAAEREAARQAKLAQPKKGGGGGGKAPKPEKPTADEARAKKLADNRGAVREQMAATDTGLSPSGFDAFTAFADGGALTPEAATQLAQLGLVEGTPPRLSSAGRGAIAAINRGDYRDAADAVGRGTQRTSDQAARRTAAEQRAADIAKRRAEAAARRPDTQDRRIVAEKAFIVFKDASGQMRWIARSTTAYEDRDREILSAAALDADSQRMTRAKQFGPLRWWHVGQPDPQSLDAPWGPGLDLGQCDYSVLIGRTRVESGTFTDPEVALKIARIADRLEMSPGFFHPRDQPIAGVFHDIRTFERSLVPMRYARASNRFTGFTVKETSMDIQEMERRFKAMYRELGLTPEQGMALGQQLVQTEKDAAAQGVAFKSEAAPAPDAPPAEIVIGGVTYAVKAAPMPAEATKAPMPPAEMVDAGMTELEDGAEEEADDEPAGNYIGDMDVEAFKAMIAELLAPVLKMQDMVKSMTDMGGELKSMLGGATTKETAELTALKAQMAQLAGTIAAINGQQPAMILPDDVAAAMKSSGPSAPDAPDAVPTSDDPVRQMAIRTFPELYQGYSENGWVKQA